MANKFYSFLNITDGVDGVKDCTTIVTLSRPEMKELGEDKKVLRCAAAISNQDKVLSNALGCEITPNGDAVWVDVSFWNKNAERFQKFMGDRDKVRVVLCGRLSVRKWTVEGSERVRVQIAASNWAGMPSSKKDEEEELY